MRDENGGHFTHSKRALDVEGTLAKASILLLGPRQTGKSALIRHELPNVRVFNLLESDVYQALSARPSLIREGLKRKGERIVIDEIQKLPALMDEVHAMIEEHGARFLLTGSSARKLTRTHTGLMGGRARTLRLHPFSYCEIPNFDLVRALTFGMLPPIYLSDEPAENIRSYVGDYVREEIAAEGLVRKMGPFSRFLESAAITHVQELNYEAAGRETQVPARTIRDYYTVLEDTLLGETLYPYAKHKSRKATTHGKFYFFDVAVPHGLLKIRELVPGTPTFATAFEHLVYRELATFRDYRAKDAALSFYRDVSQREIDFLVNDSVGIEVKSGTAVHDRDLKVLEEIGSELKLKKKIVVSREKFRRKVGSIEILPIREFLEMLWEGAIFN
jgi:uncharacterized protein